MKILMFGWEFPPHNSGGLGVACYGLTKGLAHHGEEVIFVLPKKLDISSDIIRIMYSDDKYETSTTSMICVNSLISPYLDQSSYVKKLKKLGVFNGNEIYANSLYEAVYQYGLNARHIAESTQFDIIHAHDWLSCIAGIEAKKVSEKPLVVHIHATEYDRTGGNNPNPLVYKIEQQAMQVADKVIAVSNFTKALIVKEYGIHPDKISVVHNAVDLEEFSGFNHQENIVQLKKLGYKIVLFAGRITMQKGVDHLVKAAKLAAEHDSKIMYIVAGAGDMKNQIIEMVADYGISDKFIFPGWLTGRDLKQLFASADLYVMPSISEPFGISALESIASGTPALISKQSGASEVVQHVLKVDFWDVQEMANKIVTFLRYPSIQQDILENGGKEIQKFSWKNAAQTCIHVYQSIINSL